jgi:hypothetical protein
MLSTLDRPANGDAPFTAYAMVAPHANTSAGARMSAFVICSGAMYAGVPTTSLAVPLTSSARAMPKSMTRGPSGARRTFAGLKSQWTTPAWWMATSAVAVPIASRSSSAPRRGPDRATSPASDGPSTNSLTM